MQPDRIANMKKTILGYNLGICNVLYCIPLLQKMCGQHQESVVSGAARGSDWLYAYLILWWIRGLSLYGLNWDSKRKQIGKRATNTTTCSRYRGWGGKAQRLIWYSSLINTISSKWLWIENRNCESLILLSSIPFSAMSVSCFLTSFLSFPLFSYLTSLFISITPYFLCLSDTSFPADSKTNSSSHRPQLNERQTKANWTFSPHSLQTKGMYQADMTRHFYSARGN